MVRPSQPLFDRPWIRRKTGVVHNIRRISTELWVILRKDKFALTGVIIYLLLFLMSIAAPYVAPYDPLEIVMVNGRYNPNAVPSLTHLFGTTNLGRDIFSQFMFSIQPTLLVGFTAASVVVIIGTVVGLVSGYFGGRIDSLLMRLTDIAFGIPFIPFVIVLVAFLGGSIWNIVLGMAVLLWRDTARVIRAQVLVIREKSYIEAAQVSGASDWRIIFVHVAPNVLPLAFLYGSLAVGWAILTEASVSFLGFGDPNIVSWGYMLQDAYLSQALARGAWWWILPPGIGIMLAVMAGFFIGRGYEELLYPKLKER
jgi:peptide/nickel transport system permease protein